MKNIMTLDTEKTDRLELVKHSRFYVFYIETIVWLRERARMRESENK